MVRAPDAPTGCEVMRPSRLHGGTGLGLGSGWRVPACDRGSDDRVGSREVRRNEDGVGVESAMAVDGVPCSPQASESTFACATSATARRVRARGAAPITSGGTDQVSAVLASMMAGGSRAGRLDRCGLVGAATLQLADLLAGGSRMRAAAVADN